MRHTAAHTSLVDSLGTCRVECCTILLWFYIADRTSVFDYGTKSYSRDVLGFIFLGLTLVAFFTSLKQCRVPVLLNRQQTEEWKGWMQVRAPCRMPSGSVSCLCSASNVLRRVCLSVYAGALSAVPLL